MSAAIVGAGRQLVEVLKRHFRSIGNPSQGARWRVDIPSPISCETIAYEVPNLEAFKEVVAAKSTNAGFGDFEVALSRLVGLCSIDNTLYFGSLLSDDEYVQEAVANLPPVAETATALGDLARGLDATADFPRLAYLFGKLCQIQWSETFGLSLIFEAGRVVAVEFSYTLLPLDAQFIEDLERAVNEAQDASPKAIGRPTKSERDTRIRELFEKHRATVEKSGPKWAILARLCNDDADIQALGETITNEIARNVIEPRSGKRKRSKGR